MGTLDQPGPYPQEVIREAYLKEIGHGVKMSGAGGSGWHDRGRRFMRPGADRTTLVHLANPAAPEETAVSTWVGVRRPRGATR